MLREINDETTERTSIKASQKLTGIFENELNRKQTMIFAIKNSINSFWLLPRIRLTIPPWTTRKSDKIYETKVFRHWTTGSSVFPNRKAMNEESPMNVPNSLPGETKSPGRA